MAQMQRGVGRLERLAQELLEEQRQGRGGKHQDVAGHPPGDRQFEPQAALLTPEGQFPDRAGVEHDRWGGPAQPLQPVEYFP